MATNAVWHAGNPMPANPSLNQRITWHLKHAAACGCRPIPEDVLAAIRRRSAGQKLAELPPDAATPTAVGEGKPEPGPADEKHG